MGDLFTVVGCLGGQAKDWDTTGFQGTIHEVITLLPLRSTVRLVIELNHTEDVEIVRTTEHKVHVFLIDLVPGRLTLPSVQSLPGCDDIG